MADHLDETLLYIRQQISRAVVDRRHDLHQIYVATQGLKYPELRTVILRGVRWEENSLFFHTDVRSQKHADLLGNSQLSVLGYSRKRKYQIRFRGRATLNHQDQIAARAWQRLSVSSRKAYLVKAPGQVLPKASHGHGTLDPLTASDLPGAEFGFENFVSVAVVIDEIEWLMLTETGHRRCLFQFEKGDPNPVQKNWLCP